MRYRLSPYDSARWLAGGSAARQIESLMQEQMHRQRSTETITVCLTTGAIAFVATTTHIWRYLAPQTSADYGGM
jgi:hypothetical protein